MSGYLYIFSNQKNGTLYVGVTSDLVKRIFQHKNKTFEGFTSKYDLSILIYYEIYDDISEAILREKRIKKWNRAWKVRKIMEHNPEWNDLYESLSG
jgi:putative endonuclease